MCQALHQTDVWRFESSQPRHAVVSNWVMGRCLAHKSGNPVRQQVGIIGCHAPGISWTAWIFWFAGEAMDALRDRRKEFHPKLGCPPCKPGRRLIRTDDAGII